MTKKLKPEGSCFTGAKHRLKINRGSRGKSGSSRYSMYGKSPAKDNPAGIGEGEKLHRNYMQGIAEMAANLMLKKSL